MLSNLNEKPPMSILVMLLHSMGLIPWLLLKHVGDSADCSASALHIHIT
jgi:hypothetical protein